MGMEKFEDSRRESPVTKMSNKQVQIPLPIGERDNQSISNKFNIKSDISIIESDTLDACTKLPSNYFQLIISSPPYNIGKDYEKRVSFESYINGQSLVIEQLARILKPTGSLCWQIGNHVDSGEVYPIDIYVYPVFKSHGLQLRNRIIWHFGHGLHATKRFSGRYETLLWFTKTDNYIFNLDPIRIPAKYPGKRHYKGENHGKPSGNPLGKNPSDFWQVLHDDFSEGVWEIPNVKANHPEKVPEHPCQFPVELVERCVLSMTNERDWILDPYVGVGSSLIAAIKNNRRSVGIDRESQYCEIARDRIRAFSNGTLKLRPIGKPIHKPTGREKVSQVPEEWKLREEGTRE